ncbi:MAG: hypothetical protein PWP61_643 [Trichococcus sp.]|nr:hypothetical protein [Trichococcus sp.]
MFGIVRIQSHQINQQKSADLIAQSGGFFCLAPANGSFAGVEQSFEGAFSDDQGFVGGAVEGYR